MIQKQVFLKDTLSIKYVIAIVYDASLRLCEIYEKEAKHFCGENVTLKTRTYLPKHNDGYIICKHRVKELHTNHFHLYQDFIIKNTAHRK